MWCICTTSPPSPASLVGFRDADIFQCTEDACWPFVLILGQDPPKPCCNTSEEKVKLLTGEPGARCRVKHQLWSCQKALACHAALLAWARGFLLSQACVAGSQHRHTARRSNWRRSRWAENPRAFYLWGGDKHSAMTPRMWSFWSELCFSLWLQVEMLEKACRNAGFWNV